MNILFNYTWEGFKRYSQNDNLDWKRIRNRLAQSCVFFFPPKLLG
jgi:hypothetical protein